MKKLFFFLCCLLALSATAFAEKSEWIDPGYDFTKAKSICIPPYYKQFGYRKRNQQSEKNFFFSLI